MASVPAISIYTFNSAGLELLRFARQNGLCAIMEQTISRTARNRDGRERRKLAVIWVNFGPYHVARIRALTKYFDVAAIQLAGFQRLYGWVAEMQDLEASVHTLYDGAWEDQSQRSVAVRLWRKLNELRPQTLLVPGYSTVPALAAALWGRLHGSRTLLMVDSNADDHRRRWWVELGKRFLVKSLFEGATVGGTRSQKYMELLGLSGVDVVTGYDVVDNDFFSHRVEQARSSGRPAALADPYFLYVGRMAPEKNLDALLEVFAEYRKIGGAWSLVLVGDGPLGVELREKSARLGCTHTVRFAGLKSAAELALYYAHAGCLVLPSTREPWGLVVNEAMAAGLPVIVSSRCGCADDLVEEGANGFLVNPEDTNAMAGLLGRVSAMPASKLDAMGKRSREIIGNYSPEKFASEVQRIAMGPIDPLPKWS